MKSLGAVKHQLSQVIFRHVKRQLRDNFKQIPESCKFNKGVGVPGGCVVGVCFYGDPPRKVLCDSALLDGTTQARDCPYWQPIRSKETVKKELQKLLLQGDRGVIASQYPDIAALLWVLDTDEDHDSLEAVVFEASSDDGVTTCEQPTNNHPTAVPVHEETGGSSV